MSDVGSESRSSLKGLPTEFQGAKELEVLLAEIETRLRRTILRIIRPTLDQTAEIQSRLDAAAAKVAHHEAILDNSDKLREEVSKQAELAAVLKDQLNIRDDQARSFEQQTLAAISEMRSNGLELEQKFEENQRQIQAVNRECARMCEDMERTQKEHDDIVKRLWDGMTGCFKKCEKTRDEFVDRISELHKLHNELTDELWGDNKGLNRVNIEILQLRQFVEPLPTIESDVGMLGRKLNTLELRQDECEVFCSQARASYKDFTVNCEQKLAEMAEEFREAVNQLVAHHASLMKGMRSDFHNELAAAKTLRNEVTEFEKKTTKYCQDIADDVLAEAKRLDSIHRSLTQEFEDVRRKRKKEAQCHEAEMRQLKQDMHVQQEIGSAFQGNLTYICKVLGLVIEGERLSSALNLQDYADRLAERWLGPPADQGHRPQPAHTAEMLERLPRRCESNSGRCPGNSSMYKLVPVDSQKGLARLQYLPGSVYFSGSQYDRKDLLLLQHKLLQKAHSAFQKGPPKDLEFMAAGVVSVPAQLATNGGSAGSHGAPCVPIRSKKILRDGPVAEDLSEDPKSTAASTGTYRGSTVGGLRPGSRPCSRDQPQAQAQRSGSAHEILEARVRELEQAVSSRGSMFGPLGETMPPLGETEPADETDGPEPPSGQNQPDSRFGQSERRFSDGMKGSVRLPAISGHDATAAMALNGSITAREQSYAAEADDLNNGHARCNTAR